MAVQVLYLSLLFEGFEGRVKLVKVEDTKDDSWMDRERDNIHAYEYLCHIGEAKEYSSHGFQTT